CRIIQFKEQKQNVALANHVIRSEQVFDRDICELKCYQEPNCVSYNYGPSGDGKLNACQSNPCKSNSTCQAGFGVHGYRCIFPEVNCGESCESDVDECTIATHYCSSNADCSNAVGSFQCTCESGYTGDGKTCEGNRSLLFPADSRVK
ncbi:unnamed protein product, partial [Pocillopora meandrina]